MTELRIEPYVIPAADLGLENPLPVFRASQEDGQITVDAEMPEEDRRRLGWQIGQRMLPHRLQDGYNRVKRSREFRSVVLENEFLRAVVLPELGGRLVSLVHRPSGKELVERNPVFQPANLAIRNAWFSGGIEWNVSQFGHHYLTCSPVFAARIAGTKGEPALRTYEWDRVKRFPWQIDFHLPPGSPFLFTRVRLVNPHDYELPMYWWTNIAVPELPHGRVIVPADTTLHNISHRGLGVIEMPEVSGSDASYPTNATHSMDFFFRIQDQQRKWITMLDKTGAGLIQTSTDRLRGRKLFCWGMGRGGRRWQEYLAEPGKAYIEIQAGLARTQMEHVPMPAGAEWTWVEAFGFFRTDPEKAHSSDWQEAWRTIDAALEAALPREQIENLDREFAETTVRKPDELLAAGSGWGALERKRLASQGEPDRIPPELVFSEDTLGDEQEPWLTLLTTGRFPEREPQDDPSQGMVQPEWRDLLEQSIQTGESDHWLAWLHLGNMRMEEHDIRGAEAAWKRSIELRPSAWALRNLAVAASREDRHKDACDFLKSAWDTGPRVPALAVEYAQKLLQLHRYTDLRTFVASLPQEIRQKERILIMSATAALHTDHLDEMESFFDREFTTIREGEIVLSDLWFAYQEKRIAAAENVPVDEELRERVRSEFPPPHSIDFRMSAG